MLRLPDTRFATNDGLTIAYKEFGDGDTDVVFVPGFMSHVELNWEYSFFASVLVRLGEFARVLVLDKRGTGLSDRSLGHGTLEDRMSDVRAVMDRAGVERATLIGVSEGAAMSVLMAASDPQRVNSLVLMGAMCPGVAPINSGEMTKYLGFIQAKWHSGRVVEMFVQHAPDRDEARASLARFERYCCTPAVAADVTRHNIESDVRGVLPAITVPTLVIHQRDDPMFRWRTPSSTPAIFRARRCASCLATSTGRGDHRTTSWRSRPSRSSSPAKRSDRVPPHNGCWQPCCSPTSWARPRPRRRSVIAAGGSCSTATTTPRATPSPLTAACSSSRTATASSLTSTGRPVRWLARRRSDARSCTSASSSEPVRTPGRSNCATTASAASACTLPPASRRKPRPATVLVSRTVKDLTAGSGLHFDDRGEFELKGVPERWQLYAVTA